MKKILGVLIVGLLFAGLAACGGSSSGESATPSITSASDLNYNSLDISKYLVAGSDSNIAAPYLSAHGIFKANECQSSGTGAQAGCQDDSNLNLMIQQSKMAAAFACLGTTSVQALANANQDTSSFTKIYLGAVSPRAGITKYIGFGTRYADGVGQGFGCMSDTDSSENLSKFMEFTLENNSSSDASTYPIAAKMRQYITFDPSFSPFYNYFIIKLNAINPDDATKAQSTMYYYGKTHARNGGGYEWNYIDLLYDKTLYNDLYTIDYDSDTNSPPDSAFFRSRSRFNTATGKACYVDFPYLTEGCYDYLTDSSSCGFQDDVPETPSWFEGVSTADVQTLTSSNLQSTASTFEIEDECSGGTWLTAAEFEALTGTSITAFQTCMAKMDEMGEFDPGFSKCALGYDESGGGGGSGSGSISNCEATCTALGVGDERCINSCTAIADSGCDNFCTTVCPQLPDPDACAVACAATCTES